MVTRLHISRAVAIAIVATGVPWVGPWHAQAQGDSAANTAVSTADSSSNKPVTDDETVRVLMEDLDSRLERLEKLEEHAPAKEDKIAAEARVAALKERRKDLRKEFVRTDYERLRNDVSEEYQRLSQWVTPASGEPSSTAQALASSGPSSLHGTPTGPAPQESSTAYGPQVAALLRSLDTEIGNLEARVDQMPNGGERDAAKRRVLALHERNAELARRFDQARYRSLRSDVHAEWSTITR